MQNKRSVAILCGGQSSRMGQDKAGLWWRGESFLTHLEETLASVGTLYLSMGTDRTYKGIRGIAVVDRHAHCGPLGGLHAVLERCETEQLFVTTVDQPRTDRVLAEEILSFLVDPVEAVVPVDVKGRMHPLCAAYRKSILPLVEEQIENGQYRVRDLLDRLRVCYVPVGKLTDGATKLDNINTPEDYRRLLNSQVETACERVDPVSCLRKEIPVFSVVAYSGSGKTTFLEKLIAELKRRGFRLAVIKHDAHDFEMDQPGKDSFRFTQAGADTVILASERKSVRMDHYRVNVEEWVDRIRGVDLILTEGYKHGAYQKILLFREGAGKPPAFDWKTERPFCIVSDRKEWPDAGCPVFGLDDVNEVARLLENSIRREGSEEG